MQSHEQLLLGNSLETILNEQEHYMPLISEYQFQREVLDLLENLFDPHNLARYAMYVGELTKPLRVVSNENREQVLFQVPAIVQSPVTIIPSSTSIPAENFFRSLQRDIDLGGHQVNNKITAYLHSIAKAPDYVESVLRPLQDILTRYGRTMIDIPALRGRTPTPPITGEAASTTSSFSDEYED